MPLNRAESIGVWTDGGVSNTDSVTFWDSEVSLVDTGESGPADVSGTDDGKTEMLFNSWKSRKKSPGQSESSASDPTGDVSIVTDAVGDGVVGVSDVTATLWEVGINRPTVLFKPFFWVSEDCAWKEGVLLGVRECASGTARQSSETRCVRGESGGVLETETCTWVLVVWLPIWAAISSEMKNGVSSTCKNKPTNYHTIDKWKNEHR